MTKRVKWGILILILLFIAGMALYPQIKNWLGASNNEGQVKVPVAAGNQKRVLNINAEILKYQSLTDKTISTGSTLPDEEVDLSFETSGKVVEIYFEEGTHVKQGDLLAKINDKPLQAELKKLEAQIPLAKDRVYRQRTLLARDAVSQEAFEQVSTEYEKLMADIDLVKAHIAQTELRAPFDGIIGLREVSEGAYASPTVRIARLTKIKPLKIDFSISERYSSEVSKGTKIIFRIENNSGLLEDHAATVYAVESEIETNTRTLKARALYPNENEAIKPGRSVSVEITRREIKDAIAIPSEALIPEMGKNMVYLYKSGKAEPVEIATGLRTESHIQVLDGLSVGDTLIISGVMQLRTGLSVTIDNLY